MIIAVLVVLGLCFGSFINALVWRLHEQALPKNKRAAKDKDLSITKGRSMCPRCQHTLAWYDLLPVVSWLSLGGKCRYCQTKISVQYPVVELGTAGLFAVSYVFWPNTITGQETASFVIWLAVLVGLVALVIYDLRWMLLPNRIVYPLTMLGALFAGSSIVGNDSPFVHILEAFFAVVIAGGLFYLLFQVSAGKLIGGGDVKLGFVLGFLLLTPEKAFLMLFLASLLGLAASVPALLLGKSKLSSKIPFGPFLITATVVVMLFGQSLIDWYTNNFLQI